MTIVKPDILQKNDLRDPLTSELGSNYEQFGRSGGNGRRAAGCRDRCRRRARSRAGRCSMTRILSQAWREEHVRAGDEALDRAGIDRQPAAVVQALAAVAQAHYAAANVRAKEATVPQVVPYPGGELT